MTGHDRFTADILVSLSDTKAGTAMARSPADITISFSFPTGNSMTPKALSEKNTLMSEFDLCSPIVHH